MEQVKRRKLNEPEMSEDDEFFGFDAIQIESGSGVSNATTEVKCTAVVTSHVPENDETEVSGVNYSLINDAVPIESESAIFKATAGVKCTAVATAHVSENDETSEDNGSSGDKAISIGNGKSVTTQSKSALVASTHETRAEKDNLPFALMTDKERYEHYKELCKVHGFKRPIPFVKFDRLGFRYTSIFDADELEPGSRFLNKTELSSIPRNIDKPFCHPGPELKNKLYHWYLADSIIQKIELKSDPNPNYVVRWVGYEDDFNTVEPFAFVNHTAILALFLNKKKFTANRSNNSCVRRLTRTACGTQALQCKLFSGITPTKYDHAIDYLVNMLKIEETEGRYCPEIGFISDTSVLDALTMEREFIIKKFIPFIEKLNVPLVVDKHYVGCIGGNCQRAKKFRATSKWCSSKTKCIKSYIYTGIREASENVSSGPRYVCFFVPLKRGHAEKSDKNQLNLHMCIYVIRSDGIKDGKKDAIFYNPSPPCYKQNLPVVLDEMTDPIIETVTHKFGVASEKDDCVFQCMTYIIGLATGHTEFAPNLDQPARKYRRFPLN